MYKTKLMEYSEEQYLMLSGIQHFDFCKRQWALICIEQQWSENLRTVEGNIIHERAHNEKISEKRGNLITVRGLRISSSKLGVSGTCDVVEFQADASGIELNGYDGRWRPHPVEYKRGSPKVSDADRLQLCCQAMCLEEMLCCDIMEGSIYYNEVRHRERVTFDEELRMRVKELTSEMHDYVTRGYTPKVKTGSFCNNCSIKNTCLPKLCKNNSAIKYIKRMLEEDET